MNKSELIELLTSAKEVYYNNGESIISDKEYDKLEDELRKIDPHSTFFSIVGTNTLTSDSNKIKHEFPMLSMAKAKEVDEVLKWQQKIKGEELSYCVQPKIDGLSASCKYENGKLVYVATRGDGQTGQNITHIADYVNDIPKTLSIKESLEIRGELYLPKNTEFDTQNRPLRNNCVGLINRKENRDNLVYVCFVCYQIAGVSETSFNNESDKIDFLTQIKMNTVPYITASEISIIQDFYADYLKEKREQWLFETDGLIIAVNNISLHDEIDSRWVVDHHHHYAIALKPPADFKNSKLLSIEWNISRQGNVIPVAIFEPVVIGGAKLQRASLHNAQFVRDLNLHVNDTLEIERANDVIPYVRKNMDTHKAVEDELLPSVCPSCSSSLQDKGVHLSCGNIQCKEIIIQQIIFWVRESGMEQIAEKTIRSLFEKNIIKKIKDLYLLTEQSLTDIEGFGEKKITNFIDNVKRFSSFPVDEFISKLGIPLVQKKALRKLDVTSLKGFLEFDDETYVIGQNIINWKNESSNMVLLNELIEVLNITDIKNKGKGKGIVCLTGTGPKVRKELAADIEAKGYIFSNTMTKETAILLTNNPEGSSSKLKKAIKDGIEVISYTDFFSE